MLADPTHWPQPRTMGYWANASASLHGVQYDGVQGYNLLKGCCANGVSM